MNSDTLVAKPGDMDTASAAPEAEPARAELAGRYRAVRAFTESLAAPLTVEDHVVQTMEDVSPTKWHLAHVSWFFETFILREHLVGYRPIDPRYAYLFNSYYVQAGERHCRDRRGWISRPTLADVHAYRAHVDEAVTRLLETVDAVTLATIRPLLEIGLNHEQQHQELILTDIKHVLSVNPLRPAYRDDAAPVSGRPTPGPAGWLRFHEGLYEIGHDGDGFAYDNESPRHRHFLEAFELADRLVTNAEWLEFMADGGYRRPELWLSAGWAEVSDKGWTEPFYWERHGDAWKVFTLGGLRDLDPAEPVCHVSYFEADAFARWAGARLPTEQEWEIAGKAGIGVGVGIGGRANFVEEGRFHPAPARAPAPDHAGAPDPAPAPAPPARQLFGDVWEWTRSQYSPYPGYEPPPGAIGEYNGKFMCNQFVLRGGSCATARSHIRPTYRNFFPPEATWQFSGLRLARG